MLKYAILDGFYLRWMLVNLCTRRGKDCYNFQILKSDKNIDQTNYHWLKNLHARFLKLDVSELKN